MNKRPPTQSKRPTCEVKTHFCSNEMVRRMTGPEHGDPIFWCCGACWVMLKRQGVRLKAAPDPEAKPATTPRKNPARRKVS